MPESVVTAALDVLVHAASAHEVARPRSGPASAPAPASVQASVRSLQRVGSTVMILRLALPTAAAMRWLPGQYLRIACADGRMRPFSIANAPGPEGEIELHLRHAPHSAFSRQVFEELKVGDRLRIDGPHGAMTPFEPGGQPVLLVAGGVGLAPMLALLSHYLSVGERRIALYWGVDAADDLYMDDALRGMARRHARFAYVPVALEPGPVVHLRSGYVHEAVLEDVPDFSPHRVHASGPGAMVEACRRAFVGRGLPQECFRSD